MRFQKASKPSHSVPLARKKASLFAPRPLAQPDKWAPEPGEDPGGLHDQPQDFWSQRMERASRLGHNFAHMAVTQAPIQRVKGGKPDASPRPPRQLHIFVNMEGIPANRVAVFLQHFEGRLHAAGGRGTALNIGGDYAPQDISRESKLTVADPEVKNKQPNNPKKVAALRDKVDAQHRRYSKKLDPLDEEPGKYDEVVVIGVAQPKGSPGEDDMYKAYSNVSGLANISKLSTQIQDLVKQNLKSDGHLRVQLCHAGSVKVDKGGDTFSESMVPPEKKEITISAPKNFSVIGDHGGFVDFTTKMGAFDKSKGAARTHLLDKIDTGDSVKDELEARKANFLKAVPPWASDQIKDIEFGNMSGALVDKEKQQELQRLQRLSLLGDLKSKTSIKHGKYAQEVERIAKLKPRSEREGRRLAKRSDLFGRKQDHAAKKLAAYEEEITKLG